MPASPTRLLILGAVRIFQPVHGYFVRRELLSWHAEEWAHLNPGSIYNALRTLTREGYLEELGTETHGGRPARTSYRLTADGETEFQTQLRYALWHVDPYSTSLHVAWAFSWALTREEVMAAFEHRLEQIEASARTTTFAVEALVTGPDKPSHVREHLGLTQARLDGEAAWTRDLLARLRTGEHSFAGEPNALAREPQRPSRPDGSKP